MAERSGDNALASKLDGRGWRIGLALVFTFFFGSPIACLRARLVYVMLTRGGEYVEQSQAQYEKKFRQRTLKYLRHKVHTLGYGQVPNAV